MQDHVKPPKHCVIEETVVVGGRDDNAPTTVRVHELQEGRDDAPYLTDLLRITTRLRDGIELVEEVNRGATRHLIKNRLQMGSGRAQEAREQSVESDRHQWDAQLTGKHGRGEGFPAPRRAVQKYASSWRDPPVLKGFALSIFCDQSNQSLANFAWQNDVTQAFVLVPAREEVSHVPAWLRDVDR